MRKRIVTVATAVALVLAMAVPAMATPPKGAGGEGKPSGIACQQAGISTLQSLGLLAAVAKGGIDVKGVGVLDFPTVLSLHRSNPELFNGDPTTAVTVIVPGVGEVLAFWCG